MSDAPKLRMNFAGARVFKDEESARTYYRRQGMSENQLAQLHFLPAEKVPLRIRRRAIRDKSMRGNLTRNQRRHLRRRLAKGETAWT